MVDSEVILYTVVTAAML